MLPPIHFEIVRICRAQFGARLVVLAEEVVYSGIDRIAACTIYVRAHAQRGPYDRVLLRVIGMPADEPEHCAEHIEECVLSLP